MRKKLIVFNLIILGFLSSCVTIKPVEVIGIGNFNLEPLSSKPNVHFEVKIHNPNNFGLTLCELKSTVSLGAKTVTDITISKKTFIPADSEISIPLEARASVNEIASLLLSGNASSNIKAEGYLAVRKFLFKKKFPFSVKTKI
ncbi:MAG: LEA type 2 family protein [Bacteroidia bacterium]